MVTIFEDRKGIEKLINEIKNKIIPEQINNLTKAQENLKHDIINQVHSSKQEMLDALDKFIFRMEVFETGVQTVQTKFKRLHGDWLAKKAFLEEESLKTNQLSTAIRKEQINQSKAISTLVELEFI